jgi:hypothetical protein
MQVFRSILAWCDKHNADAQFPAMFLAVRTHHLETFECRSLLVRPAAPPHTCTLPDPMCSHQKGSPPGAGNAVSACKCISPLVTEWFLCLSSMPIRL